MPLFRHRPEGFGEQAEAFYCQSKLSALCAEGHPCNTQEISCVHPFFEERIILFTKDVKLETELKPFVFVFKRNKGGLSVASYDHYPACGLDQVFGPLFLFEGSVIFFYI